MKSAILTEAKRRLISRRTLAIAKAIAIEREHILAVIGEACELTVRRRSG
jgi:hypothetical protein